jgi:hypothetical protein
MSKIKYRLAKVGYAEFVRNIEAKSKMMGCGSFAEVFYHPNYKDRVIKVAFNDKAYYAYIKHVVKHQDNPFFPKIYGVTRYGSGSTWYLVVEMEKLVKREKQANTIVDMLCELADLSWANDKPVMPTASPEVTKHLRTVQKVLTPLFKKHGNDLGCTNVMFRPKGKQAVITDPVC